MVPVRTRGLFSVVLGRLNHIDNWMVTDVRERQVSEEEVTT